MYSEIKDDRIFVRNRYVEGCQTKTEVIKGLISLSKRQNNKIVPKVNLDLFSQGFTPNLKK